MSSLLLILSFSIAASVLGLGAPSQLHRQPRPGRAGPSHVVQHPGPVKAPVASERRAPQAVTFEGLAAQAKAACLQQDSSSYASCERALQSIRAFAWPRAIEVLEGGKRAGIELSRTPTVVEGIIRGGTRVTLPVCERPGAAPKEPVPTLFFRHIWKSGGHSIMANMHSVGLPAMDVTPHFGATMWEKYSLCDELKESRQKARASGQMGPTLFTFVRDPIRRFMSGYREIEYRGHFESPHPKGSPERAAQFVQVVLRGMHNGHIMPQSQFILGHLGSVPGPLGSCPVPFDFIGKLEHFNEDWARIAERVHCPVSDFRFNRSLGEHASSDDTATLRNADVMKIAIQELGLVEQHSESDLETGAMLAALRGEGGILMRVLCWFLLADFALFDYDLPEECSIASSLVRGAPARGATK